MEGYTITKLEAFKAMAKAYNNKSKALLDGQLRLAAKYEGRYELLASMYIKAGGTEEEITNMKNKFINKYINS